MSKNKTLGIIVGRFHVPCLHAGHAHLINESISLFDSVGIILKSPVQQNEKYLIPFEVRRDMIDTYYGNKILFVDNIIDSENYIEWSNLLDNIIKNTEHKFKKNYMVGSNESFLNIYAGKYEKCHIEYIPVNKSEINNFILPKYSKDWIEGAMWASANLHISNRKKTNFDLDNIILKVDSYKMTHWKMYNNIDYMFSYFESRIGAKYDNTLFFSLQYLLNKICGKIVTYADIHEAKMFCINHIGIPNIFNEKMWEHIVNVHKGKLPLKIRAIPEGTIVPINNVLMTVENTDPKCAALTTYIETYLAHVWYGSTVATISKYIKDLIYSYLLETSDTTVGLEYMLHDFGFRGASSIESAGIGGAAHLINFKGTDTIEGILVAKKYYGEAMAGHSVVATEHSVMISRGEENEYKVIEDIIDKNNNGILSLVLDSYDIYKAVKYLGKIKGSGRLT